jgi:pimeloyl-ACP methyl ester carboxylesterase
VFSVVIIAKSPVEAQGNARPVIPYGDNPAAGAYVSLNGVRLYYETYGHGTPLLLLHGNGGNIQAMRNQIGYFSRNYQVIAMDCRGRGKSELGHDSLTYLQMTKDAASLLDYLHHDSAYVIGRSDGGIISLMLGMYFPRKVRRIAAFGANLWPDTTALYPAEVAEIHSTRVQAEAMLPKHDTTQDWTLTRQLYRLMEFQPHITAADLQKIQAPVLVLSADRDVIREEHTLFIYRHIRNANLCIFPGETHWITGTNPELFNATVAKYFTGPYGGEELRK